MSTDKDRAPHNTEKPGDNMRRVEQETARYFGGGRSENTPLFLPILHTSFTVERKLSNSYGKPLLGNLKSPPETEKQQHF